MKFYRPQCPEIPNRSNGLQTLRGSTRRGEWTCFCPGTCGRDASVFGQSRRAAPLVNQTSLITKSNLLATSTFAPLSGKKGCPLEPAWRRQACNQDLLVAASDTTVQGNMESLTLPASETILKMVLIWLMGEIKQLSYINVVFSRIFAYD